MCRWLLDAMLAIGGLSVVPNPSDPFPFPAVYRLLREFGKKGLPNLPENGTFGKRESRSHNPTMANEGPIFRH